MIGNLSSERLKIIAERRPDVIIMAVTPRATDAVRPVMGRPIQLQPSANTFPDLQKDSVPSCLIHKAVQLELGRDAGRGS